MLAAGPTCECTPIGCDGGQVVLYEGPIRGKGGHWGGQVEGNAQAALLAIQEDLSGIEGLQGSKSNNLGALLMPARSVHPPLCCQFRGLGHLAGQLLQIWQHVETHTLPMPRDLSCGSCMGRTGQHHTADDLTVAALAGMQRA